MSVLIGLRFASKLHCAIYNAKFLEHADVCPLGYSQFIQLLYAWGRTVCPVMGVVSMCLKLANCCSKICLPFLFT